VGEGIILSARSQGLNLHVAVYNVDAVAGVRRRLVFLFAFSTRELVLKRVPRAPHRLEDPEAEMRTGCRLQEPKLSQKSNDGAAMIQVGSSPMLLIVICHVMSLIKRLLCSFNVPNKESLLLIGARYIHHDRIPTTSIRY
jgi:hypothetical protein